MYSDFIQLVKALYHDKDVIALHEPLFIGNEKKYLNKCIDSTFVSSVGLFVNQFEKTLAEKLDVKHVIATVNGTAALHICLLLSSVAENHEVITQPLTFVATCNAIAYCRAHPIFIDVDRDTLGMSPAALENFLTTHTYIENNQCYNKKTGRKITACLSMHTFGLACKIDQIKALCDHYHITLIEDAAEALGSIYQGKYLGGFGKLAAMSFNGNKIITAGGGGAILTNDATLAQKAKHLTTTAKISHPWEYQHDDVGFNYRMPNINAALLCAQLENLDFFLAKKREIAHLYQQFFVKVDYANFIGEPEHCRSNYWLNAICLKDPNKRDEFLNITNNAGVATRPVWHLMHHLSMYQSAYCDNIDNALLLERSVVNIPSGVAGLCV